MATQNVTEKIWNDSLQHLDEVIMKTKQYIHVAAAALLISAILSVFQAVLHKEHKPQRI